MLFEKCPLCSSLKNKIVFDFTNGYKLVKCENCGHFFTKISKEIVIENFYTEGDYKEYDSRETIFEKIINFENLRILKKIEKLTSEKKILDFGCGKGKFLNTAKQRGWNSFGIETSIPRSRFAKNNYNIEISNDYYKGGRIENAPFSVITLFHVLEHLSEPDYIIKNLCKGNLDINGILVIEVPNFNSLQSKIGGINWLHLDIPRHINHFTFLTLKTLIEKNDLTVLKVEYFHSIHGLLGMLSSIFNLFGYRKNIMSELKYRRKMFLVLNIVIAFPFAFLLETLASTMNKGAIIRIFAFKP